MCSGQSVPACLAHYRLFPCGCCLAAAYQVMPEIDTGPNTVWGVDAKQGANATSWQYLQLGLCPTCPAWNKCACHTAVPRKGMYKHNQRARDKTSEPWVKVHNSLRESAALKQYLTSQGVSLEGDGHNWVRVEDIRDQQGTCVRVLCKYSAEYKGQSWSVTFFTSAVQPVKGAPFHTHLLHP